MWGRMGSGCMQVGPHIRGPHGDVWGGMMGCDAPVCDLLARSIQLARFGNRVVVRVDGVGHLAHVVKLRVLVPATCHRVVPRVIGWCHVSSGGATCHATCHRVVPRVIGELMSRVMIGV